MARQDSIFIRVDEREKEAFRIGAQKDDLSLADWMRKLAKKRLVELGFEFPKPTAPKKRSR